MSGRYEDGAKMFASADGQKFHWAILTLYTIFVIKLQTTSFIKQVCSFLFHIQLFSAYARNHKNSDIHFLIYFLL